MIIFIPLIPKKITDHEIKRFNCCSYKSQEQGKPSPFVFFRTPLGSVTTSQPSSQPGTPHCFDIDPSCVKTGATDPNVHLGTNGLPPDVWWLYTSSEIVRIPCLFAVCAIYSNKYPKLIEHR